MTTLPNFLPPFTELVAQQHNGYPPTQRLLALDPGGTTGWAVFDGTVLEDAGQQKLDGLGLQGLVHRVRPDVIVLENYRIYRQKAMSHIGSEVLPARLIGALELIAESRHIPLHLQMAGPVKAVVTDDKLRAWVKAHKQIQAGPHARDAIRHGLYFLLFPPKTP